MRQSALKSVVPALLALLVFTTASPTAKAALKCDAKSVHARVWNNLYKRLPAVWKSNSIVVVREVDAGKMKRLVESNEKNSIFTNHSESVVDGYYQSSDATNPTVITLLSSLKGKNAALVFLHEYGHVVWDRMLNAKQRERYASIWYSSKRAGRLISEYAKSSFEEGFAETFAAFVYRPATLRRADRALYRYYAGLAKNGKPAAVSRQQSQLIQVVSAVLWQGTVTTRQAEL